MVSSNFVIQQSGGKKQIQATLKENIGLLESEEDSKRPCVDNGQLSLKQVEIFTSNPAIPYSCLTISEGTLTNCT